MSEKMQFLPKAQLLTLEELAEISNVFIDMGVKKIRVTGGEPLVRRDILAYFKLMGKRLGHGLEELTLTTNASQLEKYASILYETGVRRVNISLDTLDHVKFREITRIGDLDQVQRGIRAAQKAGLKIKINTVALKGFNDDEVFELVEYCAGEGFDLTFIEVMPMGDIGTENRLEQFYPLDEIKRQLTERYDLIPSSERTGGPARYLKLAGSNQKIGFISPLTQNFCDGCNRVRLTCTGQLYQCLGQSQNADLRAILRENTSSQTRLKDAIRSAITQKPKGHDFGYKSGAIDGQMPRHMNHTGG